MGELESTLCSRLGVGSAQVNVPVHRLVFKPLHVLGTCEVVVDELLHERVPIRHFAKVLVRQKDLRIVCALRI